MSAGPASSTPSTAAANRTRSQIGAQCKGVRQVKDDPRRERVPVARHQAQGHQAVGINKVQGPQIDLQGLPGHSSVRVVEKFYEEFAGRTRRQLIWLAGLRSTGGVLSLLGQQNIRTRTHLRPQHVARAHVATALATSSSTICGSGHPCQRILPVRSTKKAYGIPSTP